MRLSSQDVRREAEELSHFCKSLEHRYERELEAGLPMAIRLDGVGFKKFTSSLVKPFDPLFTRAIIETAKDLLEYVPAQTAFCQSDEITLFTFPDTLPIPFSGRTQKIASVVAAFASVRFSRHMQPSGKSAWFDGRVVSLPHESDSVRMIKWRHAHDCRRNAVNSAACAAFTHSSLQSQSVAQVISRLKAEKNIDFFKDFPPEAIYGSFVKRLQVKHVGFNPKISDFVDTMRTRIQARTFDLASDDDDAVFDILHSKYWLDHHKPSLVALH